MNFFKEFKDYDLKNLEERIIHECLKLHNLAAYESGQSLDQNGRPYPDVGIPAKLEALKEEDLDLSGRNIYYNGYICFLFELV